MTQTRDHFVWDLDATMIDVYSERMDYLNVSLLALYELTQHLIGRLFVTTSRGRMSAKKHAEEVVFPFVERVNFLLNKNREAKHCKTHHIISHLEKCTQKKVEVLTADDFQHNGKKHRSIASLNGFELLKHYEQSEYKTDNYIPPEDYTSEDTWVYSTRSKNWMYELIAHDLAAKSKTQEQETLHIIDDLKVYCLYALDLPQSRDWPQFINIKTYWIDSIKNIYELEKNPDGAIKETQISLEEMVENLPPEKNDLKEALKRFIARPSLREYAKQKIDNENKFIAHCRAQEQKEAEFSLTPIVSDNKQNSSMELTSVLPSAHSKSLVSDAALPRSVWEKTREENVVHQMSMFKPQSTQPAKPQEPANENCVTRLFRSCCGSRR